MEGNSIQVNGVGYTGSLVKIDGEGNIDASFHCPEYYKTYGGPKRIVVCGDGRTLLLLSFQDVVS